MDTPLHNAQLTKLGAVAKTRRIITNIKANKQALTEKNVDANCCGGKFLEKIIIHSKADL